MTKSTFKDMPEIIALDVKDEDGNVLEVRKYYTAKGLADRLPGRKRNGGMNIGTVYGLFKEGMPGITTISGMRLLPVKNSLRYWTGLKEETSKNFSPQGLPPASCEGYPTRREKFTPN